MNRAILLAALFLLVASPVRSAADNSGSRSALTVSLSATSLFLGDVAVGTTSASSTVSLINSGNSALAIVGIVITGINASDFAQSNNCGGSVAAEASCTFSVTMTPSGPGLRRASLSVLEKGVSSAQTVSLMGVGILPVISIIPTGLNFASRPIGTTSAAQAITVKNDGIGIVIIDKIAITGADTRDYAQTNNCGSSVGARSSCSINVTFTPLASGSRTALISITDNAGGGTQTVGLFGTGTGSPSNPPPTGIPPNTVSLSPASLAFANQPIATTSTAQTFTLSNANGVALSITATVIEGTNPGDFAEVATTCGTSVAAGATCSIGITFTPSGPGQRTATFSISDNASGSPQTATLTGTGTSDVILSWSASSSPGVIGYNVYRGLTSGGEGSTPVNSDPISGTTYVDTNVTAGKTYYYVLTSVNTNGAQSAPSSETEATVPSS